MVMKKQRNEFTKELFEGFKLTNHEMLNVKGGKSPIDIPKAPPIKI